VFPAHVFLSWHGSCASLMPVYVQAIHVPIRGWHGSCAGMALAGARFHAKFLARHLLRGPGTRLALQTWHGDCWRAISCQRRARRRLARRLLVRTLARRLLWPRTGTALACTYTGTPLAVATWHAACWTDLARRLLTRDSMPSPRRRRPGTALACTYGTA